MKRKTSSIISLGINVIIVVASIIGCGGLMGNWFHYPYQNFTPDWTDFLKSIGFLSAIYAGAVALVVAIFLLIALMKKKENYSLPKWLSIVKLSGAVLGIMAIFEYFFVDVMLLANSAQEGLALRNFLLSYQGGILVSILIPMFMFLDYVGFAPTKRVARRDAHYAVFPVAVFFVSVIIYPSLLSGKGATNVVPDYFVFQLLDIKRYGTLEALTYCIFLLLFAEFVSLALSYSNGEETPSVLKEETPSQNEDSILTREEEIGENREEDDTISENKENTSEGEVVAENSKAVGKYEVYPEAGMYKYRLKANNGEILIVSNNYKTRDGAKMGIETLKKNLFSGTHKVITDKNGYSQFRIFTAKDARLVASGEIYRSVASAQNALASTQRFGISDKVIDLDEIPASEVREEKITLPDVEKNQIGKVELYIDNSDKKWRSRLLANNGEILFTSAAYSTKAAALNGLTAIKTKVANNGFHISRDKQGRYQYVLYSDNGLVLLLGETYNTREAAISSASSVRAFLADSPVIDMVAKKKEMEKKTALDEEPKKAVKKTSSTKGKKAINKQHGQN